MSVRSLADRRMLPQTDGQRSSIVSSMRLFWGFLPEYGHHMQVPEPLNFFFQAKGFTLTSLSLLPVPTAALLRASGHSGSVQSCVNVNISISCNLSLSLRNEIKSHTESSSLTTAVGLLAVIFISPPLPHPHTFFSPNI